MSSSESDDVQEVKTKGRPKAKKDSFIELKEIFDQHKLNHIVKNENVYRGQMRLTCFEDDYNPFTIATKYLSKSNNGNITTKYKQNLSYGRFYAMGSLSLQSMPREIRHTIAKDFYNDIDIKNAHPVILAHLCDKIGVSCKWLKKYNKKRDEFLSQMSDDKEQAKTVVLSIINGGQKAAQELNNPPEWLKEFKKEIKIIHKKFSTDKAFKTHKKKRIANDIDYNHEASYMNTLLCDFENKILQTIYKALNSPKDCILCFDGIMIRKNVEFNLESIQQAVEDKLDIEIQLTVKEMTEGFEIEHEIEQYIELPKNTFDFTDKYTYSDFYNQYNAQEADDILDDVIHNATKVIAHITKGKGFYIKKLKDGCLDIVDVLGSSGLSLKTSKSPLQLKDIMKSSLSSFGEVKCILDGSCPQDDFNLWTGFQAKRVNLTESDGLKLMKSFILECWANNNLEHYNYIISWIAGLFTNLRSINKVALVMISGQGTGKGTLIEFLELLLRSINVVSVAGVERITGRFNTVLQGKRLVNINEMSSTKEEFKRNFDTIKTYITDPTIEIEPKGVDSYKVNNISNFVMFSQHRDSIIVEGTDRRYAVFEMGHSQINNTEYFGRIRKECFNQSVADEFYTYLLDFPAVPISKIPDTELRQEMMNMSKPSALKFIDAIFNDSEMKEAIFDEDKTVKSTTLYTHYKNWCSENGERNIITSTKFGTVIKDKLIKKRNSQGIVYEIS